MELQGPNSSDEEDWEDREAAENRETAAEKRLRLAKRFIEDVREQVSLEDNEFDAADVDRDNIADRLQEDAMESLGRIQRKIASSLTLPTDPLMRLRGHTLSVTSVALTSSGKTLYTGSKDGSIIKWDLQSGKRLHTFHRASKKEVASGQVAGHTGHILALTTSPDEQYLASGAADKTIRIWSIPEDKLLGCFTQHKDHGLVFRRGSNDLYSCSKDRSIKLWSVEQLAYMETLFGHQDEVTSIDALMRERCVTVGSRDRTVRMWKIAQESQLVFRGGSSSQSKEGGRSWPEGSMDVVTMLDEGHFVSGSDAGTLSLWSMERKKPIFTLPLAHGVEGDEGKENPRWITSLRSIPYTDTFASGSWDGSVRLWKVTGEMREIVPLGTLPAPGFVNSLSLSEVAGESKTKGKILLVAGTGQEHRFGRWWSLKKARNAAYVFSLSLSGKEEGS
ncbi:RNA, U3 small nucleolar interacting protein 2, isoform CRA_b [Piptocephalis cylindrospora]|uniref:RNA, U3 small nucleolar interacting protein 2, isoform CRA_b n=1 Tax=Piptocephalis cylindrospora TaxID=1907219 RepID=A0A4P9Y3W4_9FUNG|nr:RNA, U3 small nucleolar interacting protein 2, isoform CRA_b [Piptocephalis cylindrospora]|eukprot:RKP12811.1 RNA, U3 small nucleolar interacting protein 2, isoform CRA_b [Piptocephalis cylindrospora]